MEETEMRNVAITVLAILALTASAYAQQAAATAHTTFNGFWVGMTTDEFLATDKGKSIVGPYKADCESKPTYSLGLFCPEWESLTNKDMGGEASLNDPFGSKAPFTIYTFNEHKLESITYCPDGRGAAIFDEQVRFLTVRHGKPTRSVVETRRNDNGTTYNVNLVQWECPDGITISAETRMLQDDATIVKYFIPHEPKKVTKNPY